MIEGFQELSEEQKSISVSKELERRVSEARSMAQTTMGNNLK